MHGTTMSAVVLIAPHSYGMTYLHPAVTHKLTKRLRAGRNLSLLHRKRLGVPPITRAASFPDQARLLRLDAATAHHMGPGYILGCGCCCTCASEWWWQPARSHAHAADSTPHYLVPQVLEHILSFDHLLESPIYLALQLALRGHGDSVSAYPNSSALAILASAGRLFTPGPSCWRCQGWDALKAAQAKINRGVDHTLPHNHPWRLESAHADGYELRLSSIKNKRWQLCLGRTGCTYYSHGGSESECAMPHGAALTGAISVMRGGSDNYTPDTTESAA